MREIIVRYFLFSIIFFFSSFSFAEASYFRNYQVEDGLSHDCVWAVMQDGQGYMWFGTNDGLNRFDGKNFDVYKNNVNDSLSIGHNFIHCIKEISQNRLLIGTRKGVYQYNRETDNFKQIVIHESNKEIIVNDILEDIDGDVWLATHGDGLYRLNSQLIFKNQYLTNENSNSIPMDYVWTVVNDNYGNLWIGTAGKGFAHFNKNNERFTRIADRNGLDTSKQSVYSIFCDENNYLWVGTSTNGLFQYNYITGEVFHYLKNIDSIKSIKNYSDSKFIMGSESGLILFDKALGTYQIIKDDPSDENIAVNSIFSIEQDREGAFWIGTYFNGVNYFSPAINNFVTFNKLSEKFSQKLIISSMVEEADGNILLATYNNNIIYRYNVKTQQTEKAFTMEYNNILSMLRDDDKLYVNIYGRGIYVLSIKTGKILEKINLKIVEGNSIFKTSEGTIIFALEESGYACREKSTGNIKRMKEFNGMFNVDITEDSKGKIWFATHANGLFYSNPDGSLGSLANDSISNNQHRINNNLTCILSCEDKYIWLGTKDKGLILLNPEEKKIQMDFTIESGMPSNMIFCVLEDKKGDLWVSTGKGIVKIDKVTKEIKSTAYIGKEIQYKTRCALKSSSNQLYFGGVNGFICLNPEKLVLNKTIPNIVITSFKISNKEIEPGEKSPLKAPIENTKEIVLKRNQSNFSFEFIALSYIFPESNKYAYILEGFDKEWNYINNSNIANYTNIPAGKYIFRVKGTNNDDLWSEFFTDILIRIKPTFWFSYYMIVLYLLTLAFFVFITFRWYFKRLDKKNKENQYKYQIVKEKETYESKINFFTNIAHEIRTPLSLITGPLENIIQSKDGNEQTQKNLTTIERNTNRLLNLVNQLLDFRKIENDMFLLNFRYQNIVKIVQKVYDQYSQEAKSKDIEMTIDLPSAKILSYIDSEALYKIISNLISNAIKFTRTKIDIELKIKNSILFLSIKDDGMGIKDEFIKKIFDPFYQIEVIDNFNNKGSGLGLSLSKSLAKKLGGDIVAQSKYGKGCSFTIELPILINKNNTEQEDSETAIIEIEQQNIFESQNEAHIAILIVEDNEELRSFMKDCLSAHYTVYEAENGLKALGLLENNIIDIIISDILMPGMDGLELCNELKKNTAYSHIPLILLSAKTDTSTKIDGLKKGADVYMEKPFSIEQLKAQVNSIIENRTNIQKKLFDSPLQYFKRSKNNNENADFIRKLNTFIIENMSDENFTIDNLACEFAISRTNFQKKIKSITGLTPNDYIKLIRLNKSAELLSTGKYRINEVCFLVGFNTPSYFSKCFYEHFGKLPKDFMDNNPG